MAKVFFFLLSLILLSSLTSAIQLVVDSNFNPGETLIAELKGNVISPIKHSDVNFYYGNKLVSLDYDIAKLGSSYFLYANLPLDVRDYRLVLSNVKYFEQGKESVSNITANLSVNGSVVDFSVTPGVIVTNKDFLVTIKNLGNDLSITSSFNNQQSTSVIGYGRVKELTFPISSIAVSGLYFLSLSSSNTTYSVPVYVISASGQSVNSSSNISAPFRMDPTDINLQVIMGVRKDINLTIENLGAEMISKITLSYSSDLSEILRFDSLVIENLSGFAVRNIPLRISTPNRADDFEGLITAFTENFSDSSKVFISSVNQLNSSARPTDNSSVGSLSSCVSIGGILCFSDEVCVGNYTNSLEGLCCMSQCASKGGRSTPGSGSSSTILIVIAVLVLLGIGYMFFKKYKASKSANTSTGKINDLTKKFDNQFKDETKK